MKYRRTFLLVVALFLPSVTLAQSQDAQASNDQPTPVNAARCTYTPTEGACIVNPANQRENNPNDKTTLAQAPGRAPYPPRVPARGYSGPGYPNMWANQGSRPHALIGAIIGFGLGAAIAAKGRANIGAVFAIGGIGAGLGAGIGFTIPSFPSYRYRRPWDDEYEEDARSRAPRI